MQWRDVDILVSGILPQNDVTLKIINAVNHELHNAFNGEKYTQIYLLKHQKSNRCEIQSDGSVINRPGLLKCDGIHLSRKGYQLFMQNIKR